MPIYAYRCEACGFAKDVLQKVSDAALTECPSCSQSAFRKQVTAAGFQLKGSGWYVTDFRDNGSSKSGGASTKSGGASTQSAGESASTPAVSGGSTESSSGGSSSAAASPAKCG